MAVTPEAAALTVAFNQAVTRVREQTARSVVLTWAALRAYNDDNAPEFVERVVPLVRGAQAAVVAAVDAYLALFASLETGVRSEPVGLVPNEFIGANARNGADPAEVYRRPFVTVWSELGSGTPWEQAVTKAQQRVDATVQADVMLAHRAAAVAAMTADDRIVGYKRVLSGVSCGLCAVASTQRYRKAELMPIHDRCDCTVEPIIGNVAPSRVINPERLARLQEAAGADYSSPAALKRLRVEDDGQQVEELPEIRVEEHGEKGPVLVDARHHFTGPDEIREAA